MAGVLNKTAKQFNLKGRMTRGKKSSQVTVRLVPGFNSVPDEAWKAVSNAEFVKNLSKKGLIEHGKKLDEREFEGEEGIAKTNVSEKPVTGNE